MPGDQAFGSFARHRGQGTPASSNPKTTTKRMTAKMNCMIGRFQGRLEVLSFEDIGAIASIHFSTNFPSDTCLLHSKAIRLNSLRWTLLLRPIEFGSKKLENGTRLRQADSLWPPLGRNKGSRSTRLLPITLYEHPLGRCAAVLQERTPASQTPIEKRNNRCANRNQVFELL